MKPNWKTLFLLTTCCTLGFMTSVRAQITPDNSLGAENSTLGQPNQAINGIPINQIDQINGGARRGGNLFHSFGEFNVNAGRGAYFTNPDGVGNIFTRVTGVNRSNILGTLGVLGNANLFLINPNGIFFGANASLDVRGSFLGSSANSLLFDNGFEFSATNPQAPPLLTVNIPIGLRFRDNPGNITNQSVVQDNTGFGIGLRVNPGNSLALVGGNVSLEQGGRLTAAGGRIELGGLAGAGTVGLQTNGNTFRLNFPTNGLSNVSLLDDARVAVRSNGGGDIAVNANIFRATNGGRLVGGIEGIATRNGGDITVNSNEFNISGVGQSGFGAVIAQQVVRDASGNAGNIVVNTKSFNVSSGGQLQNTVLSGGTGNAGDISITSDSLSLSGGQLQNSVLSGGTGNAGNISITSNSLSLTNAEIDSSTSGRGNAGNISLQVGDAIALSDSSFITTNVQQGGSGIGGDIDISARSLTLTGSSQIQAGLFRRVGDIPGGIGTGGSIKINATDFVDISGFNAVSRLRSGIFAPAETGSTGPGGSIDITTGAFRLSNFGIVTARNDNGNNGGNITINAKTFEVTNGLVQTTLSGQAEADGLFSAGDIKLNVSDSVTLKDGAQINSRTFGRGNAGNISLQVGNAIALTNRSEINSSTFGQGNAGNVTLRAENGDIFLAGGSFIFSTVGLGQDNAGNPVITQRNAGKIDIIAKNLTLTDGSQLQTLVGAGQRGNAGNITVQASGDVSFSGFSNIDLAGNSGVFPSGVISSISAGATGSAGDIDIRARSLTLTNASQIQAVLFSQNSGLPGGIGTGGSIKINASDFVDISGLDPVSRLRSGIFASAETGSTGPGGSIDITTGAFRLSNFGIVIAATANGNNGGNITINAKTFEATNGLVQTALSGQAEAGRLFSAGNIQLNVTDSVTLKDDSLINSSTSGIGNAGNISLQVGNAIALANSSQIRSNVDSGGEGIGGDIDIRGRSLTLTEGSQILTALFRELNGLSAGKGRAGNIDINATDFVNIFGVDTAGFSSGLFTSADRGTTAISPQAAGNINLTTGNFRIADGAVVNALTSNSGDAGNITINANTFTASGGGQVLTTTRNSGNAGNINLNVRDRITISGSDPNYNQRVEQAAQSGPFDDIVNNQGAASGIFANTGLNSTGNGGNIIIQPLQNRFPTIAISDGAEVTVDSQGQGQGGEITITGNSLTLDRGIINASTQSGDGGNINLRLRNFIRLRNESLISANARGQQGGNGGNITIETPFIVAFPQNNDIIANAVSGSGGRVTTNATLFGIIPRTRADLERLGVPGLNPRNLSTSDITAFSEQNSNFGDNVQVNSPDVDPSRGLVELPETVTDTTQQVAQNPCRQGFGNEFVVTGRGGLPTSPNETLNSNNVRVDLLQPVASSGNSPSANIKPATTVTARRVPAQGWIFNDKGQVVLTAYDPTNTDSQRSFSTAAACPAR